MKICRLVEELIQREGRNHSDVARELARRGFKSRTGKTKLGELNALGFGVAAVGGASATAAIAKMYNQFLLNKTDTAKVNNMLSDLRNEFNLTKQAQAKFEQLLGRVLI